LILEGRGLLVDLEVNFRVIGLFGLTLAGLACGSSPSAPARFGTILVESDATSVPVQSASASFYRTTSSALAQKCFVAEDLGACRLWHCVDYVPPTAVEIFPLSAGSVGVDGAKAPLALQEVEPGTYAWDNTLNAPLWDGGEMLQATLGGSGEFPPATLSLTAPDPIAVTAPAVPPAPWQIDSQTDLAMAWSGALRSDVNVAISIAVPNPIGGANLLFPGLDCGFSGAAGAGVIPAWMLQLVPKPSGIAGHDVSILTLGLAASQIGDALLEFRAASAGLSALATIQ
jgi:hypothetical protein